MPFVLDSSVTLAWCFEDEIKPYTEGILDQLRKTGAIVPVIWPLEVANVLLLGERRRRLTVMQREQFIRLLHALPIVLDTEGLRNAFGDVLTLGRMYDLTVYNASYLEAAIRRGLPLATLDTRLSEAASQTGVALVQ